MRFFSLEFLICDFEFLTFITVYEKSCLPNDVIFEIVFTKFGVIGSAVNPATPLTPARDEINYGIRLIPSESQVILAHFIAYSMVILKIGSTSCFWPRNNSVISLGGSLGLWDHLLPENWKNRIYFEKILRFCIGAFRTLVINYVINLS